MGAGQGARLEPEQAPAQAPASAPSSAPAAAPSSAAAPAGSSAVETTPLTKSENTHLVPGKEEESEWVQKYAAPCAISFYVVICVLKTMLTKALFNTVSSPIAFSSVSVLATCVTLVPVFIADPSQWAVPKPEYVKGFALVCVFVALDMGLTNWAMSLLAVAIQQCIVATNPAFTVTIESIVNRKLQHSFIYLTIIFLCTGPIVANVFGETGDSKAKYLGTALQLIGVVMSASKYVFAKSVMNVTKKDLGNFAFLFWTDVFVLPIQIPWALIKGEFPALIASVTSGVDLFKLLFTAVLGGVRFFSQLLVLRYTSATTLACSNLAYQATNIYLSLLIFGEPPLSVGLVAGSLITLGAAGLYTYFKLTRVLEKDPTMKQLDDSIKGSLCFCCMPPALPPKAAEDKLLSAA